MFANPCVSAWPVGLWAAAALASAVGVHPMACACAPQLVPFSKLVSLAAAYQPMQLFSEHPKALEHAQEHRRIR